MPIPAPGHFPIPDPPPLTPSAAAQQGNPYYVRQTQDWAVAQERQRHDQLLYTIGEYCVFVLMWHEPDLQAGLVNHCSVCAGSPGSITSAVQDVYQQPMRYNCPNCFGTTFDGGYKAIIVRPALFGDSDETEQKTARGVVETSDLGVESTTDFLIRNGDYVFRANGNRYYLRAPARTTLRTGFASPTLADSSINYNQARASLEDDKASVAYELPPDGNQLPVMLHAGEHFPAVFAQYETIKAPLIPDGA